VGRVDLHYCHRKRLPRGLRRGPVALQAWDGWTEPPHIWGGGVGDPGGGTSPGADVLLRDVVPTLERRMSIDHPEKLRAWVLASEMGQGRA
jgi:hypothetical protein